MTHTADLTKHAQARIQQRGIPRMAIEHLLDFGREYHDHHGAVIVMLDHAALRRMERSGTARGPRLDRLRGLYAVVGRDGSIRTAGHRTKRLPR